MPQHFMRKNLLIISLEPSPYNVDLFNAFIKADWNLTVFYSQHKDWSKDGGHDYQRLPPMLFSYASNSGRTIISKMYGIIDLTRIIRKMKPDVFIISGYNGLIQLFAIFYCILFGKQYAFWGDRLNTSPPRRGGILASVFRSALRFFVFRTAFSVLMCGKDGVESALQSGCSRNKLIDFPYVVCRSRLQSKSSNIFPIQGLRDIGKSKINILFSGRLIARKGLDLLLEALSELNTLSKIGDWKLWIEGDGPLRQHYERLTFKLSIADRCSFLGFCQMDVHSWLLRECTLVVLPSLEDPWGIVVDEAMQVGKPVCASSLMGSARDRISNGVNGILFHPTNKDELKERLTELIGNGHLRIRLGQAAYVTAAQFTPARNVHNFEDALFVSRVS